ncbi:MAG: DUF2190 family protein [Rhodospirillales bacterium]
MHNPLLTKNFTAGAAVTKRRIVKFGSADYTAIQAAATGDAMFGVSAELDAASGERFDVHVAGVAEVEYGGNVTRGELLTADADGKAVAVTRHTHAENAAGTYAQDAETGAASAVRVIGTAMVSGVDGDIGSVQINPAAA